MRTLRLPRRLVDEWESLEANRTLVLNPTLCARFPDEYCPSGGQGGDMARRNAPDAAAASFAMARPGCCL